MCGVNRGERRHHDEAEAVGPSGPMQQIEQDASREREHGGEERDVPYFFAIERKHACDAGEDQEGKNRANRYEETIGGQDKTAELEKVRMHKKSKPTLFGPRLF